jgi:predicted nucleotidyltransferase
MYIFETIHGSRLYGLSHANSDYDYLRVLPFGVSKRSEHEITGTVDAKTYDLPKFLRMAGNGYPQAVEAMFSEAAFTDEIGYLRKSFHPSQSSMIGSYNRRVRGFVNIGNHKSKRHALRLVHNLNEFLVNGRFNPTLDEDVIDRITEQAHAEGSEFLRLLRSSSTLDLFGDYDLTYIAGAV